MAVECATCGVRGLLVIAYGPAATAEEAEVLTGSGIPVAAVAAERRAR